MLHSRIDFVLDGALYLTTFLCSMMSIQAMAFFGAMLSYYLFLRISGTVFVEPLLKN